MSQRARTPRPGAVHAAERQAVRTEPVQERDLHDDGTGLRRQSERVLRVRSRDEEGRQLQPGRAAACGRGSVPRSAATAASTPGAATATTNPEQQIFGQTIIAREAEPGDQGARDERLVHADQRGMAPKRDLDMNVTGPVFECKGRE